MNPEQDRERWRLAHEHQLGCLFRIDVIRNDALPRPCNCAEILQDHLPPSRRTKYPIEEQ